MSVLPLSKLSDWELEDTSKDLRGLKLVDRSGRTIGTIDELLVDTDRARVDSVRTEDGRLFAVEPLEIRDSEVVFQEELTAIGNGVCCGPITVVSRSDFRHRVNSSGAGRWQSGRKLRNARVLATDGDIDRLHDIYFNDHSWTVRYLVVDTSKWLPGRKVLISPEAMLPHARNEDSIRLDLTRDQIRNSPARDTERPVSRQWLSSLHSYYGWGDPAIMSGTGLGYPMVAGSSYGVGPLPAERTLDEPVLDEDVDEHLRSMNEITGYHIEASDGDIGHVDDFVVDMAKLQIEGLVVDTSNMPGGRSVMIPVHLVDEIRWPARTVRVRTSREEIGRMREPAPELRA